MNLYVVSEQIGLQGYWITDILAGITKEAMKKNITVLDYNGQKLEMTDEFTRPIVLAWVHGALAGKLLQKAAPVRHRAAAGKRRAGPLPANAKLGRLC